MTTNLPQFQDFGKIARFSRDIVITEKLDGTNAQIHIVPFEELPPNIDTNYIIAEFLIVGQAFYMFAGSRNRYLTLHDDNYGFASWALANAAELYKLGAGRHYGEWWGSGIQRGYGLPKGEKRFSLFNTHRWSDVATRPVCCHVVPVLRKTILGDEDDFDCVGEALDELKYKGSYASPGFMNPEGIIIYHTAANVYFKKTLDKDEEPKGKHAG